MSNCVPFRRCLMSEPLILETYEEKRQYWKHEVDYETRQAVLASIVRYVHEKSQKDEDFVWSWLYSTDEYMRSLIDRIAEQAKRCDYNTHLARCESDADLDEWFRHPEPRQYDQPELGLDRD